MAEQWDDNPQVAGSNPAARISKERRLTLYKITIIRITRTIQRTWFLVWTLIIIAILIKIIIHFPGCEIYFKSLIISLIIMVTPMIIKWIMNDPIDNWINRG